MTNEELLSKLTSMFNKRYGQRIADMNKNIYSSVLTEGTFEVPVPTLSDGGGTVISGEQVSTKLNRAAYATVKHTRVYSEGAVYRIAFQRGECEIAANSQEYFNYFFDTIINQALLNYNHTFGGVDKVRFGTHYCKAGYTGSDDLFRDLDGGDYLELRLNGMWAGTKEVPKLSLGETTNE